MLGGGPVRRKEPTPFVYLGRSVGGGLRARGDHTAAHNAFHDSTQRTDRPAAEGPRLCLAIPPVAQRRALIDVPQFTQGPEASPKVINAWIVRSQPNAIAVEQRRLGRGRGAT